ncbi:MAG: hypothetical protein WKF77_04705 [Planctomycetaceae bacterium]
MRRGSQHVRVPVNAPLYLLIRRRASQSRRMVALADEAVEIFGCILPVAGAGLLDDVGQCFKGFG